MRQIIELVKSLIHNIVVDICTPLATKKDKCDINRPMIKTNWYILLPDGRKEQIIISDTRTENERLFEEFTSRVLKTAAKIDALHDWYLSCLEMIPDPVWHLIGFCGLFWLFLKLAS